MFGFSHLCYSLGIRLDDALFQRLVESRWDEEQASGGKGVDCDGFLRLYFSIFTPATTFGRHLRKAAGRGDQDLGEKRKTILTVPSKYNRRLARGNENRVERLL